MDQLGSAQVPLEACVPASASTSAPATAFPSRHSLLVRITHWITALCFFALLVTGAEIVVSHPRFYWGETGNVLTTPLFQLPIPSSRALVPTGYGYVLPDQNGWSRALHFQAAWLEVLTGLLYAIFGLLAGHFRKNLFPGKADLSWRELSTSIAKHLRFERPSQAETSSYNVLRRLAYGMNGNELPVGNGGPLRLRVPRQLGYKNVKFITRLTLTDSMKGFGKGLGSASPEQGYAWYAGI